MSWQLLLLKAKVKLPKDDDSVWANQILRTEALTDGFISDIKAGNFDLKGIDSTLAELRFWKENPNNAESREEIRTLRQVREFDVSPQQLQNRIKRIITEVLPVLEGKRKGGKQKAGQKGGKARKYDISKESISEVLDTFEELTEEEQHFYIKYWNNAFSHRGKHESYRPFLSQKYSTMMKPILENITLADIDMEGDLSLLDVRVVTVKSKDDLTRFGFSEEKGFWKKIVDKKLIVSTRGKLVDNVRMEKFNQPSLPIVSVFGLVKKIKDDITVEEYTMQEPFTAGIALKYLNTIAHHTELFLTKKIKEAKKAAGVGKTVHFVDKYLRGILELEEEDLDNFAESFIKSMETKIVSTAKLQGYYARMIHNALKDSNWYWKDFGEESWDSVKHAIFKELTGRDGIFKDKFEEVKKKIEESQKREKRAGVTPSQKEFIELIITRDLDNNLFEGINEVAEELIKKLKEVSPTFKADKIEIGEQSLEFFTTTQKDLILEVLTMVDSLPDSANLKEEWEEIQDENEEVETQLRDFLAQQEQEYEVEFNKDVFSTTLEKQFAEIIYKVLQSDERLDDVLSGEVVFSKNVMAGFNFTDIVNAIIVLDDIYHTGNNLGQTIIELEEGREEDLDFNVDSPPLVEEIKQFTGQFVNAIPQLRTKITQDIEDKVKDIIAHPLHYKKEAAKGKTIFKELIRKGIIEVKSNEV